MDYRSYQSPRAIKNSQGRRLIFLAGFQKIPSARLSIVVAGWWRETASPAVVWLISNCLADDGRTRLQRANDEFKIQSIPIGRKGGMVWISGAWEVMSRPDRRRLKAALTRSLSFKNTEREVLEAIRAAARQPAGAKWIDGDILTIAVTPEKKACAIHHPLTGVDQYYAPLFLWYKAGRNFIAGDAWAIPSGRIRYRWAGDAY